MATQFVLKLGRYWPWKTLSSYSASYPNWTFAFLWYCLVFGTRWYSWFATTWHGGHVAGQYNKVPSGERCFWSSLPTWPPWRHVKTSNNLESVKVFITDLGLLFVFQLQVKARMEYGDSSVYFPFTFTQQDIDNVLYGYIRTPEKSTNGFALSGIYVALANGRFDH